MFFVNIFLKGINNQNLVQTWRIFGLCFEVHFIQVISDGNSVVEAADPSFIYAFLKSQFDLPSLYIFAVVINIVVTRTNRLKTERSCSY